MPAPLIRRLPKIDLHIHLEGSLPRATLAALAARHRMPVPPLGGFAGLPGFLKSFGAVSELLVDEEDFDRAARDLFRNSRRIGVVHLEVLISPQVFLRRGIALAPIMRGLLRARARLLAQGGLSAVYILDGVRQWGGEWFDEVVRAAAPWAGRGLAGVGVGGDEAALPARDFRRAFLRARSLGLRATIHAGEAAGPESIREALALPGVRRIGHGVRAVEDAALVRELVARKVTLEVCPSSNLATGAAGSWSTHPLRRLFEAGVLTTLNSDDGAFFDTDVEREMSLAMSELAFTREELLALTRNAARGAFVGPTARRRLERRIVTDWSRSRPFSSGKSMSAGG